MKPERRAAVSDVVHARLVVHRRAGFSIIEALVALAITSMALTLLYAIGNRARDDGFRLGRRALDATDAQVTRETLRSLLLAFVVPPPNAAQRFRVVTALSGDRQQLSGAASLPRPGPCGGPGPARPLLLRIEDDGNATRIVCSVDGGPPSEVVKLTGARAHFEYALDGNVWGNGVNVSGLATTTGNTGGDKEVRLLVRLSSSDGRIDIVEALTSGLPPPFLPPANDGARP